METVFEDERPNCDSLTCRICQGYKKYRMYENGSYILFSLPFTYGLLSNEKFIHGGELVQNVIIIKKRYFTETQKNSRKRHSVNNSIINDIKTF